MKRWIILVIAFGGLAAGGYFFWLNGKEKTAEFRTAKVIKGPVVASVSATGVIRPINLVQVGSQVSGTIVKINVDFNKEVKAGDVLCELDKVPLEARVAQDRANLTKAQARLEVVNVNLATSKKELERAEKLANEKLISASELDRERAKHDVLKAELKLAEAEIKQSEATLQLSIANLSYATISSPVDGVVVSRSINVGQTVAASLHAPLLFEIAESLETVHILGDVSEADIGMIKDDQNVSFTVDAYPDSKFYGSVQQIRLSPKNISNVVTYTVVVLAKNIDEKLLPGMTANMRFIIGSSPKDGLKVLNMALRFEPDPSWIPRKEPTDTSSKDEEQKMLWVLEHGKLKSIPVETGISDGRFTYIAKGEVKEGQEVVVGIKREGQGFEDLKSPFQQQWRGPRRP